jgi:hypothetical protein
MGAETLFWDFRDKKVGDKMSVALEAVCGPGETGFGLDGDIRRAKDRRDGDGDGASTLTLGVVRCRDNDPTPTKLPPLARRVELSEALVSEQVVSECLIIILQKQTYLCWR